MLAIMAAARQRPGGKPEARANKMEQRKQWRNNAAMRGNALLALVRGEAAAKHMRVAAQPSDPSV